MKKLMNFRPTLFIAVAVVLSVIAAYYMFVGKNIALGSVILSIHILSFIILPLILCVIKKKFIKRSLIFSVLTLVICSVAFSVFYLRVDDYNSAGIGDKYLTVNGRVDEIENLENGVSAVIGDVTFSGALKGKPDYRINVYIYGKAPFDVGDEIKFSSVVSDKSLIYEGVFAASDVDGKVRYYAQVSASEVSVSGNFANLFQKVNLAIRNSLKSGLGEDEFAVAYALLCGNSEYSGTDVLSSYRQAGVAHVFAVSGLHIGFLAAVFGFIFRKMRLNPYLSAVITCIILFFYSGVCGFTMSSLRASIMCGTAMFVYAVGGRYDGLSSVSISAIILSVIFPTQIFCAGFDLSFSVVYGIIIISKPVSKIFRFLPKKISSMLGAVIAAQIFSIPVLIAYFGEFTILSFLTNFMFIPFVGFLYVFLFFGVVLSVISPIFLYVQDKIIYALNYLFGLIEYEGFMIGGITLTASTVFYYGAAITASGLINLKRLVKITVAIIFELVFAVSTLVCTLTETEKVKAYVIGSSGICLTSIEGANERTLIISTVERGYNTSRIRRLIRLNGEKETYVFALFGVDVNTLMSSLNPITEVKRVYFYGSREYESIYENSFKKVKFSCVDGDVTMSDYTVRGFDLGTAASARSHGREICVYKKFGSDEANSVPYGLNYGMVVGYDSLDVLSAIYKNTQFVSYRNSTTYANAERQGNFCYNFN